MSPLNNSETNTTTNQLRESIGKGYFQNHRNKKNEILMVVRSLLPHLLWGTKLHNYNYEVEFGITTEPTCFVPFDCTIKLGSTSFGIDKILILRIHCNF